MQVFDHHIIFDEITYDREELKEWYDSVKQYLTSFAELMNKKDDDLKLSHDKKFKESQIKTIDTHPHTGIHIKDYEPIAKLVKQFDLGRPLIPRDVDVLIMRPGVRFNPHIDYHMHCGIMFPILPDVDAAPIDFYQMPPGAVWKRAQSYASQLNFNRDFLYSYHYSMQHPSMFNGDTIHGVREVKQERVFLRFKCMALTFNQVIEKAKAGNFILPL